MATRKSSGRRAPYCAFFLQQYLFNWRVAPMHIPRRPYQPYFSITARSRWFMLFDGDMQRISLTMQNVTPRDIRLRGLYLLFPRSGFGQRGKRRWRVTLWRHKAPRCHGIQSWLCHSRAKVVGRDNSWQMIGGTGASGRRATALALRTTVRKCKFLALKAIRLVVSLDHRQLRIPTATTMIIYGKL